MLTSFLSLKRITGSDSTVSLANKYTIGHSQFYNMTYDGTRLLYLSLCSKFCFPCFVSKSNSIVTGSPYILALIAITHQKNAVLKQLVINDIASIGAYLRQVPGKSFYLFHMRQVDNGQYGN